LIVKKRNRRDEERGTRGEREEGRGEERRGEERRGEERRGEERRGEERRGEERRGEERRGRESHIRGILAESHIIEIYLERLAVNNIGDRHGNFKLWHLAF
jgi:hypothetical protein